MLAVAMYMELRSAMNPASHLEIDARLMFVDALRKKKPPVGGRGGEAVPMQPGGGAAHEGLRGRYLFSAGHFFSASAM